MALFEADKHAKSFKRTGEDATPKKTNKRLLMEALDLIPLQLFHLKVKVFCLLDIKVSVYEPPCQNQDS